VACTLHIARAARKIRQHAERRAAERERGFCSTPGQLASSSCGASRSESPCRCISRRAARPHATHLAVRCAVAAPPGCTRREKSLPCHAATPVRCCAHLADIGPTARTVFDYMPSTFVGTKDKPAPYVELDRRKPERWKCVRALLCWLSSIVPDISRASAAAAAAASCTAYRRGKQCEGGNATKRGSVSRLSTVPGTVGTEALFEPAFQRMFEGDGYSGGAPAFGCCTPLPAPAARTAPCV
jgi:hypothetical protein